jgi:hypothetical protein
VLWHLNDRFTSKIIEKLTVEKEIFQIERATIKKEPRQYDLFSPEGDGVLHKRIYFIEI